MTLGRRWVLDFNDAHFNYSDTLQPGKSPTFANGGQIWATSRILAKNADSVSRGPINANSGDLARRDTSSGAGFLAWRRKDPHKQNRLVWGTRRAGVLVLRTSRDSQSKTPPRQQKAGGPPSITVSALSRDT